MALPNMAAALTGWTLPITLKTTTTTTIDFIPTTVVSESTIQAVVQVAQKETLNQDNIDWSLRYLMVHSVSTMDIGQYIEYNGIDYKIIQINNYGDYGYYEVVAEEVKGDLI